ncbi:glycerophosphoryl diester phosphodiesterase membrane domain-containing protein [Kroppenstedtia eburnea]|uniref:glycerophosphoryl diester phosphodiesterase membrane domain-containing protein n=1 Tax=Kroppenstedtia eburnea TaxID=714067 RepID=UPI003633DF44
MTEESSPIGTLRPWRFTEVLDGVFRTLRTNLRSVWMVCGTFIGLGTFFLYFSIYQLESGRGGLYFDPYEAPLSSSHPADWMLLVISGMVYILSYLFLGPLAGASVTGITRGFVRGEAALPLKHAFRLAVRFGGRTLVTMLIKWLLIMGAALVPLTPGLLVGLAGWWQVAPVFLLPGGLVSFGLLTFFYIRFFLAVPVILEENTAYWGALKRSWRLTRRSFWRTFGLLFMLTLILYVFNMLPSLAQLLLMIPAEMFLPPEWFWVANLIQAFLMAVLTALLAAPTWIVATLVYFERRVRKEGLDLIRETGRLEESAL